MEETVIDLRDLFKIITRRKWIIIAIILISVVIGLIISFIPKGTEVIQVKKEVYKSTASIVIGTFPDVERDNIKDITILNQQIVKIYGAVASSRTVAEKTIEDLNLDVKIDEFMGQIKVIANPENQVITIHYVNKEESNQQEILESYVKIFVQEAQKMYPTGKLKILDGPSKVQKMPEEEFVKLTTPQIQPQSQVNVNQTVSQNTAKSKKLILAISFMVGLMIGLGVVFVLEYVDNSLKKKEEAEEILKINTLAIIPNNKSKENIEEAFRSLRTNLQLKEDKIFTITSASAGDGKTDVSINLAKTFAEAGFKTLIIDGNGRTPRINEAFSQKNSNGISEILNDITFNQEDIKNEKGSLLKDIHSALLSTNVKNLNVLSWGNEKVNPADLLGKVNVRLLLEELKNNYEYIIIDTTAIVNYCDGQIFSKVSDGTLIVASEYKTNRNEMIRLKEILDIASIDVSGLVWIKK